MALNAVTELKERPSICLKREVGAPAVSLSLPLFKRILSLTTVFALSLSQSLQADMGNDDEMDSPLGGASTFDPDIEFVDLAVNEGIVKFEDPIVPQFLGHGPFVALLDKPDPAVLHETVLMLSRFDDPEDYRFLTHTLVWDPDSNATFIVSDMPILDWGIYLLRIVIPNSTLEPDTDENFGALVYQSEGGGSVDIGNGFDDPLSSATVLGTEFGGSGGFCKFLTSRPSGGPSLSLIMIVFSLGVLVLSLRRSRD